MPLQDFQKRTGLRESRTNDTNRIFMLFVDIMAVAWQFHSNWKICVFLIWEVVLVKTFVLSKLVGENGSVTGVDMTEEQVCSLNFDLFSIFLIHVSGLLLERKKCGNVQIEFQFLICLVITEHLANLEYLSIVSFSELNLLKLSSL